MKTKKKIIIFAAIFAVFICGAVVFLALNNSNEPKSVSKYVTLPEDIYNMTVLNAENYEVKDSAVDNYINLQLMRLGESTDNVKTVDTIDDAYTNEHFGMTKQEYIDKCTADFKQEKEDKRLEYDKQYIYSYIVNNSQSKTPEKIIESRVEEMIEQVKRNAEDNDKSLEDFIKEDSPYDDIEDFEAKTRQIVKYQTDVEMYLRTIAEHYKLDLSEDGYQKWLDETFKGSQKKKTAYFEEQGGTELARLTYYKDDVLTKLWEDADKKYGEEAEKMIESINANTIEDNTEVTPEDPIIYEID